MITMFSVYLAFQPFAYFDCQKKKEKNLFKLFSTTTDIIFAHVWLFILVRMDKKRINSMNHKQKTTADIFFLFV